MNTPATRRFRWSVALLTVVVLGLVVAHVAPTPTHADEDDRNTAETNVNPQLFAIGAISASDVWTTYMMTAVTSDHFVKEGYTAQQVGQILGARMSFNGKSISSLEKVAAQPDLSPGDKQHVGGLVAAYKALSEYAESVLAFTKDKNREKALASEAKRKAAWAKVQAALGIK